MKPKSIQPPGSQRIKGKNSKIKVGDITLTFDQVSDKLVRVVSSRKVENLK